MCRIYFLVTFSQLQHLIDKHHGRQMCSRKAKKIEDQNFPNSDMAHSLLKSLIECSNDFILISDKMGRPLFFNNAYKELMKMALGIEMKPGLVPHKLLRSPEAIAWWDGLHARVLGGDSFKVEYSHEFDNGMIRHFELSYTPVINESEVQGFTEISRDITGRKEAEQEIARSQSQLKTITNSALDSIFSKDIDRRYTFVNPAMTELLGCSEEDLLGKKPEEVFDAYGAQIIKEVDDQTFSGQKVDVIRPLVLNGERHFFHTVQVPMDIQDGVVTSINGIVRDVTNYILVQKENILLSSQLRDSEQKYRRIFENSPLGIVHLDRNGIITTCNKRMADILESRVEKLIGFDTLVSGNSVDLRQTVKTVLSGKVNIVKYEGRYRSVTGSGHPYLRGLFSVMKTQDGSVSGAIGIFEDITDRKEMEDALQQAHEQLELRVAERTAELYQERERLQDANIALNILLEKRKEDKSELETKIIANIDKLITPYLQKLQDCCRDEQQKMLLDVVRANLNEITSTFADKHNDIFARLTPKQLQIADLIRQGYTTKEIATFLNLSASTVACHRQEIRKRLSLNKKSINLQSLLSSNR